MRHLQTTLTRKYFFPVDFCMHVVFDEISEMRKVTRGLSFNQQVLVKAVYTKYYGFFLEYNTYWNQQSSEAKAKKLATQRQRQRELAEAREVARRQWVPTGGWDLSTGLFTVGSRACSWLWGRLAWAGYDPAGKVRLAEQRLAQCSARELTAPAEMIRIADDDYSLCRSLVGSSQCYLPDCVNDQDVRSSAELAARKVSEVLGRWFAEEERQAVIQKAEDAAADSVLKAKAKAEKEVSSRERDLAAAAKEKITRLAWLRRTGMSARGVRLPKTILFRRLQEEERRALAYLEKHGIPRMQADKGLCQAVTGLPMHGQCKESPLPDSIFCAKCRLHHDAFVRAAAPIRDEQMAFLYDFETIRMGDDPRARAICKLRALPDLATLKKLGRGLLPFDLQSSGTIEGVSGWFVDMRLWLSSHDTLQPPYTNDDLFTATAAVDKVRMYVRACVRACGEVSATRESGEIVRESRIVSVYGQVYARACPRVGSGLPPTHRNRVLLISWRRWPSSRTTMAWSRRTRGTAWSIPTTSSSALRDVLYVCAHLSHASPSPITATFVFFLTVACTPRRLHRHARHFGNRQDHETVLLPPEHTRYHKHTHNHIHITTNTHTLTYTLPQTHTHSNTHYHKHTHTHVHITTSTHTPNTHTHTRIHIHITRMLGCWDAGMLGCWDAGMLECWNAGMMGCRDAGMLGC
jgi:hypothetical protein